MAVDPIRGAGDPQQRVAGVRIHALFEAHARMVFGLCLALLRDPHDAEDATQTTFISAYRSLLRGSDVREPAAWLATIARNECATRARARMREPLPLLEADLGHSPDPQTELDRLAVVEGLQEAIAGLPERQREAVVLRDLYGLPYSEVGAALGMSLASVESLLFRARRTLRTRLRPLGGGVLTVPFGVREGIAQALPAFSHSTAAGGGAASGAVGLGLLSKLAGGPAAVKAAAGLAAAVAAASIAVTGIEHGAPKNRDHVDRQRVAAITTSVAVQTKAASPVAVSREAPEVPRADGAGTTTRSGGDEGGSEESVAYPADPKTAAAKPVGRDRESAPERGGSVGVSGPGSPDASVKTGAPALVGSDDSGSRDGTGGSHSDGSDDAEPHEDVLELDAPGEGTSHEDHGSTDSSVKIELEDDEHSAEGSGSSATRSTEASSEDDPHPGSGSDLHDAEGDSSGPKPA